MGILAALGLRPPPPVPDVSITAAPILDHLRLEALGKTEEDLWREQPHLRTVVDFLARNIAQLGIHAYKREGDDGRHRVRTGFLPKMLLKPNPNQTGFELVRELVSDLALYDHAYWLMTQVPDSRKYEIRSIRPMWVVERRNSDFWQPGDLVVQFPGNTRRTLIPQDRLIEFHGWDPVDPRIGNSPVEALRAVLAEQIHGALFRSQMWTNGGRIGSYITRPKDAPTWDNKARHRFADQFRASYSGPKGTRAGGTPILEDGMELRRVGFSAREEQYVEANKLSLQTVASVYHINPTMVGLLDNANYSNMREFRRMLYGETLGPIIRMIEQRLNAFMLPAMNLPDAVYVEFNVESRLRGSFEEQGQVMRTAIGGPWMTINEGRALQNLPMVDDGDALIKPLNLAQEGEHEQTPVEDPDADQE